MRIIRSLFEALMGSVRPAILFAALSCLLLAAPLRLAVDTAMAAQQTSSYTPAPITISKITASAGSATTTTSSTPPKATTPAIVAAQPVAVTPTPANCAPDTSYTAPTALDLTGAATGLTTSVSPTHYYQVNGYTSTQIRQQIQSCAPKLSGDDDFTGYTSYRLSWSYSFAVNNDGACTITAPKIGIRIAEVLPNWQASSLATPGLATQWAAFAAALDTHEHGHITLDQQYATQILASLQAMPATDCGAISAQAIAIVNNGVAALDAANANYDTATNHGATQGAILP